MKKFTIYIHCALGCALLTGKTFPQMQQQEQPSNVLSNAINSAVKYGPAVAALGSALFTPQKTQAQQNSGLWNLLFGSGGQQEPVQQAQPQANQTIGNILPMLFGQPQQYHKAQTHAQTTVPKFFQEIAEQPPTKELSDDQMRALFDKSHQMTEQLFKSMGLPVPQLTSEQKEQMFQFSKKIFEQNKDLFNPSKTSQKSEGNFLQNLLGAGAATN